MSNSNNWQAAMTAGTVVGLVCAAWSCLKTLSSAKGMDSLASVAQICSIAFFVLLVYGFTRRYAAANTGDDGFSFADGLRFIFRMMIFTGIVAGVWSAISNNFLFKDFVLETLEEAMTGIQDMVPDDQFTKAYETATSTLFNPVMNVVGGIVGYMIGGGFVGLIIASLTKRDPAWTQTGSQNAQEDDDDE